MSPRSRRAAVWLGDVLVGHIWSTGPGASTFSLDSGYMRDPARPVLGARFEDMRRPRRYGSVVPTWFANVLPEGLLRDLVAAQRGAAGGDDLDLLIAVGADLPGNVRVTAADTDDAAPPAQAPFAATDEPGAAASGLIKFSLAGVQLKFSMYSDRQRRLRLNGARDDTAVIVKTPDAVHANACENEFLVMSWAAASGVHVPPISLVPLEHLEGLPPRLSLPTGLAFAIERYDRSASGRIHQEDMCQVLDHPPTAEGKYRRSSYEEVGRAIASLAEAESLADVREYVRRLVFMVASGNGDAHLKNWSLLYPDGLNARLAPAYDLMATIVYPQYADECLALPLDNSRRFADVKRQSFRGIARRTGRDEATVLGWVDEAVERTLDAWNGAIRQLAGTLQLPDRFVETLERHMASVPLLQVRLR